MTLSHTQPWPLDNLLERLCEQSLSEAEAAQLNQLLRADAGARRRYLVYMELHGGLYWDQVTKNQDERDTEPGLDDAMILPAMRDDDNATDVSDDSVSPAARSLAVKLPPRAWFNDLRRWRLAAMLFLALGGLVAVFAVLHARSPAAATLTATVDAQWDQQTRSKGDTFAFGTTSRLISGFAELHFAGGATVIAEGPAEIVMKSDREMFVSSGKIFATVPGGGFVVSTPVATITDLGTEFGVSVSGPDQCEVAVFKGKVQVEAKAQSHNESSAGPAAASTILIEGQTVAVSSTFITPEPSSALAQRFTRTLQAGTDSLDLVDVVAGGDGTTHRRGLGIDPSGNWGTFAPVRALFNDGIFHPVPGLAAVDGVFLPKSQPAVTQLDSAGDSFVFPAIPGASYGEIWAGGTIPTASGDPPVPTILDGVDYSTPGHGLLFMHSARGLTFDLNAIRRLHPDRRISGFRCLIGNSYPGPQVVSAAAWIFIDGRQEFSALNFTNRAPPSPMLVPIHDADHYLTLVTGSLTGVNNYLWVLAVDPVLSLQPR